MGTLMEIFKKAKEPLSGELITVRSVVTKILFDAANANALPAMTEKVHLPVLTVAILARCLEPWTVLKPMTPVG